MDLLKYLLILAVIVGAYQHFGSRLKADYASPSPNGFVSVQMPDDGKEDVVLILAPLSSPSNDAKRADALAARLNERGIPNRRGSSYLIYSLKPGQVSAVERAKEIMRSEAPAVFINGMAKANPSVDEVVAEYERTK